MNKFLQIKSLFGRNVLKITKLTYLNLKNKYIFNYLNAFLKKKKKLKKNLVIYVFLFLHCCNVFL